MSNVIMESDNPVFSIIIPTYNCEGTIKKCLYSVLCQTFTNIEIIIVDGFSIDETLSIVNSIKDYRIKILSESDKGIYDAMNKGIKLAKGEWTYFLGSDDSLYDEEILEYIFTNFNDKNYDVVYGNVLMTETNKIYDGVFNSEKIQTITLCHQAIFYRKKVHYDLGLYNIKYKVLADHDLNLKWFFSKKHKHIYVDKIIANYSINGYSSIVKDTVFYDELPEKLFCLGFNEYNLRTLKELSIRVALNNKNNKNICKYLIYKIMYFTLRVLDLIKRRIVK